MTRERPRLRSPAPEAAAIKRTSLGDDEEGGGEEEEDVEGLVDRDSQARTGLGQALDLPHVGVEQAAVVLDRVGDRDDGGDEDSPEGVGFDPDPYKGGYERHHVGEDVRGERAPVDRVWPEAVFLVGCLPVGLEEEVADQVGDDENREDLGPVHSGRPAISRIPAGYATRRQLGRLDK